jgi:hypothetical protein
MNELTCAQKFLSPDSKVYDVILTKTYQYPGKSYNYIMSVDDKATPTDIKLKKLDKYGLQPPPGENFEYCVKCCKH